MISTCTKEYRGKDEMSATSTTLLDTRRDRRPNGQQQLPLARLFRCCSTDQRLEILETLLGKATDNEIRITREEHRTRRGSNGRFVRRTPPPNASRASRWERSREAWQVLEGCFYRYSKIKMKKRAEEATELRNSDPRMNLNPHMLDGLRVLFEEHGQYLGKLCNCLGLEVEHE